MARTTVGRPRTFNRTQALDQAARLFWARGYEAASIRDLTAELGVSPPSLYSAFGDKSTLFAEAVAHYENTYGVFVADSIAGSSTARGAAQALLTLGPVMYTRPGLPQGCLIELGDSGPIDPPILEVIRRTRRRKGEALRARIEEDMSAGLLSRTVEPVALAQFTMSTLGALARLAREGASTGELETVGAVALGAWPSEIQ